MSARAGGDDGNHGYLSWASAIKPLQCIAINHNNLLIRRDGRCPAGQREHHIERGEEALGNNSVAPTHCSGCRRVCSSTVDGTLVGAWSLAQLSKSIARAPFGGAAMISDTKPEYRQWECRTLN